MSEDKYLKPWQAMLVFSAVAVFAFGLIFLSARMGIHWPLVLFVMFTLAGAAASYEDDGIG